MKIIIFGGAGFIGKNLVRAFAEKKYDIVVYDRIDVPFSADRVRYVQGNLSDVDTMADIISQGDIVVHLAWNGVPADQLADAAQNIISDLIPTVRLFSACVKKHAKKIIFMSSGGAVYGKPQDIPMSEAHPLEPLSDYGINKLACEKYLKTLTVGTETQGIVLRLANPYGPFQRPFGKQGVVATFLASALLDKEICVWGDGSAVRDYVYIDDVVKAVCAAVNYSGSETVFNVASGEGNSVAEIIQTIERITGKTLNKTYKSAYVAEVGRNILDCTRISSEFGWSATTTLEKGIRVMLDCWNPQENQFNALRWE